MGSLKTYVIALVMGFIAAADADAQTLVALPSEPTEQARVFAGCAGRYSALREHAWLMSGQDPQAEANFALFEDLLDAVRHDAFASGLSGRELLDARLTAKMAQARLLTLSTFDLDADRARRARAMARQSLRVCEAAIFG